ncbi:hypothetical protein H0R92_13910, partial [Treponema sp. OMZ 840]|uniref:hypothetical protein n=1 Tax=Treponema sp. OMZ 840 TaxID=244313 RepID=UPI003D900860
GITQQAASAQNPVPQPVVVAGEGEKKGIKTLTNKIADTFFKNDGAKTIHTIGGAASRTTGGPTSKAGSIGLYINPENEALFNVATKFISTPSTISKFVGISLITANIEDIGCYVAIAGGGGGAVDIPNTELSPSTFVGLAVGSYKSVADAQGPYQEIGGSIGKDGLSVGIDAVKNLENETIGYTTSIGFTGKPLTFEAHYRVGVTKLYSFTGKTP